jgi:hypothetical protein
MNILTALVMPLDKLDFFWVEQTDLRLERRA